MWHKATKGLARPAYIVEVGDVVDSELVLDETEPRLKLHSVGRLKVRGGTDLS